MSDPPNDGPRPRGTRGSGRHPRSGARRGYSSRAFWLHRPPSPDPIPNDLGEVRETISKNDLVPIESEQTRIRNVECIASYNLMGGVEDSISISIPGALPKWAPPPNNPQLNEDSGTYFRDINAAYMPQSPLQATALAILANPSVDTTSADILTCASVLRSLFLFVRGQRNTFRIMATAVGETVFFLRREGSSHEVIPDVRGYGHSMPGAYTMWHSEVKGSVSSQRVIRYDFAGLSCLVRYEPDGYLPDKLPKDSSPPSSLPSDEARPGADFDIDAAMHGLAVSSSLPAQTGHVLTVKRAGFHIPQAATFDLKTRTAKRKGEDFFADFAVRLWSTQTPHFILAFHTRGTFNDIRVRDVRDDILEWETANQEDIKKLAGLLELVVERVRAKGVLELWRHEEGDLQFLRPQDVLFEALPAEIADRWTGDDSDRSSP